MCKILIIEDNPDNLYLATFLLQQDNHKIIAAHDGKEGIELANTSKPDLIICDIDLPIYNGFEVLKKIKENSTLASIPIIALTALAMVGDRAKILSYGFDGYIPKPIIPQKFTSTIAEYLNEKNELTL